MTHAVSLLWLAAVLVAIPVVLWLLKRTPMLRGLHTPGAPRTVASLPLSPQQRVVTVEVGQGEQRQWLVLGVGPQGINTLHTMPAGAPETNEFNASGATAAATGTAGSMAAYAKAALRTGSRSAPGAGATRAASATGTPSPSHDPSAPKSSKPPERTGRSGQLAGTATGVGSGTGTGASSSLRQNTGTTFAQLLQRLRTPGPSASKRSPGNKPPRDSKPGNHGR
jgi:flagellar protein FliO/FliZ